MESFLRKKMKNRGMFIAVIINLVLFVVDLILSFKIKFIELIEINPLYSIGGFGLISIVNLLVFLLIWYFYIKTSNTDVRFILMSYICVILLFRVIVIINNYSLIINPLTYEEALMVTSAIKRAVTIKIAYTNVLPFFISLFTWAFFRVDHNIDIY